MYRQSVQLANLAFIYFYCLFRFLRDECNNLGVKIK